MCLLHVAQPTRARVHAAPRILIHAAPHAKRARGHASRSRVSQRETIMCRLCRIIRPKLDRKWLINNHRSAYNYRRSLNSHVKSPSASSS